MILFPLPGYQRTLWTYTVKSLSTRAMKKLFRNMNYSVNKVWNILCSAWYFTHVLWCQCKCKVWMQLLPWTKVKNAKQLRALFCPFLIENPWFLVFPSLLRLTQITFKHYYNYCILLASYILILYERLSPHMQVIETILSTKRTLEGVKSNFDFMLLVIFFFLGLYMLMDLVNF